MSFFLKFLLFLFILILEIFSGIIIYWTGIPKEKFINIKCKCKYQGPFYGKIINFEKKEPVKNAKIICWWEIKRKNYSGEIFYEVVKTLETATDEKGIFFIPRYPEAKNKYICCPKMIIFYFNNINLFDFKRNLKKFSKNKIPEIYFFEIKEEQKAKILKELPSEIREILFKNLSPDPEEFIEPAETSEGSKY